MRKVLSFVLVLSLVLGSFSFAFAGAGDLSDINGLDCEDAVNVLSELNVVTGYPDGSYKPENIVTRAEMAVIIIKAMGLEGYATGKSSFTDMAGYDWAQGYVAYAQSVGIIAGYGDGTFKPGQTVSYNEAAKMLVAALGWTPVALVGSWPANYVSKAQDLGILDGITAIASGANRGDIAVMTFQTLDCAMVKIQSDEDVEYLKQADGVTNITLMDKLGVEDYDMGGAIPAADEGQFIVNGDEDSVINLTPFVGKLVTAYQNDDEEILAIKEVKSTALTGEYDAVDGTLDVDGTEYTLDAATTTMNTDGYIGDGIFANGGDNPTALTNFAGLGLATGDIVTVNADVSGKKINDLYSMEEWTVTEGDYWDADYAAEVTDEQSVMNVEFALDDNDNIDTDTYDLLGATDFASIPEDAIVYVYEGNVDGDDIVTKVEVGTTVITGEITKIKTGVAGIADDKYTIDGVAYEVATANAAFSAPDAGDEVNLYLDYSGDVYDVDKVSGDADKVAVVLNMAVGSAGSLGDDPQVELMLADGTSDVFDVDFDEVTDDGTDTSVMVTIGAFNAAFDIGDLIEYSVGTSGKITAIDLQATQSGVVTNKDITASGYWNGKKIDSDAVIFTFDATAAGQTMATLAGGTATALDDGDFDVTTLDDVLDTDSATGYYYLVDDSATGNIAVMIIDSAATGGDDLYGVVTDKGDNSSDAEHYVEVLVDSAAATYDCESIGALVCTTIYAISFDTNGYATLAAPTAVATGSATATDNDADGIGFSLSVNSSKYVTLNTEDTSPAGVVIDPVTSAGAFLITTGFSLDPNVDVYTWDASDLCFVKGSIADMKDNDLATVEFFDLADAAADLDGLVDIVLVTEL